MKTVSLVSLVVLALSDSAAAAEDLERGLEPAPNRLTLGAGFEYSSGDYGSSLGDTNDWYVPFSLGYTHTNWRFKARRPRQVPESRASVTCAEHPWAQDNWPRTHCWKRWTS